MCGIAGYVGEKDAVETVFSMLKRLEYRGYDSAGVACIADSLRLSKDEGKVDDLRSMAHLPAGSRIAIGHSRWATHGPPSRENAHPHTDSDKEIAIVHNGIIENHGELRRELAAKGVKFRSQTDSEIIVHLIRDGINGGDVNGAGVNGGFTKSGFEEAFLNAIRRLEGSFAVLAIYEKEPDKILFARNESPLLVGIGSGGNFLASDMPAIIPETRDVIILDDMEYGILTKECIVVKSISSGREIKKPLHHSTLSIEAAEKGGHKHFMIKEILEESAAVSNALRSRSVAREVAGRIKGANPVYLVACGTAWHAAVVGKYLLQEYGVPAMAEVASEFRYSTAASLSGGELVILISQSGETADTIAAAKAAKKRGAKTLAIVNVVGSSLTRVADESIYSYSGPEIAVASTKAYIGQLSTLLLLLLELLLLRGKIKTAEINNVVAELEALPQKIDTILDNREKIRALADILRETDDYFYIARGLNYPTAMEGALKLKEISYLHAEAYPGGELKHGPLALMEPKVCVVAINSDEKLKKKMDSNIEEIRSRKARVIELLGGEGFAMESGKTMRLILPKTHRLLTPILSVVPLHLLSYYVALAKGLDIDKPRNLAKSVTVE